MTQQIVRDMIGYNLWIDKLGRRRTICRQCGKEVNYQPNKLCISCEKDNNPNSKEKIRCRSCGNIVDKQRYCSSCDAML